MIVSITLGLVLLFAGGDLLVRGSVSVARRLGVSSLMIGLTLVGFGTSTPELVTSLLAALRESPGIAVGNVVGSNTANILLILGVAALVSPIVCDPAAFRRDAAVVLGSAVLLAILAVGAGRIGLVAGALFLVLLFAYIALTYLSERRVQSVAGQRHETEAGLAEPSPHSLSVGLLFAVGGIGLTIAGAALLVDGAIELAGLAGISDTVIGLTVVAVGTSLPELFVSVIAAFRRQGAIALGNIIGSNIYNILGILGLTAIISPLPIPAEIARFDIWIMLAATALLAVFALTGSRISRGEGLTFLALYVIYAGSLIFGVTAT